MFILIVPGLMTGETFTTENSYSRGAMEYLRCYVVYSGNLLFGFACMIICVDVFHWDAVWSNLGVTALNFAMSFIGHRFFSFRPGWSVSETDGTERAERQEPPRR